MLFPSFSKVFVSAADVADVVADEQALMFTDLVAMHVFTKKYASSSIFYSVFDIS
jgi:hypothetical protein